MKESDEKIIGYAFSMTILLIGAALTYSMIMADTSRIPPCEYGWENVCVEWNCDFFVDNVEWNCDFFVDNKDHGDIECSDSLCINEDCRPKECRSYELRCEQ